MLKIKAENNKLKIENEKRVNISFELSQKHIFNVIKANIDSINKNGCSFYIEKFGQSSSYLVLEKNNKLLLPDLAAYEIQSRMQLLAEKLNMPSDNVEDTEE